MAHKMDFSLLNPLGVGGNCLKTWKVLHTPIANIHPESRIKNSVKRMGKRDNFLRESKSVFVGTKAVFRDGNKIINTDILL